jgi:hypothetical protein
MGQYPQSPKTKASISEINFLSEGVRCVTSQKKRLGASLAGFCCYKVVDATLGKKNEEGLY